MINVENISHEKEAQTMCKKELYVIGAAIVTAVFVVMFFPVMGNAQNLPPVPTPPILNNIPPAWSQTLQCDATACPRFELVMGGAAVLDHETGLVWQRTVDSNTTWTWAGAINQCNYVNTGDRWGWHLPTVEQLMTLNTRRPQGVAPKLPEGHPFIGVSDDLQVFYWTATTYTGAPWSAWRLSFGSAGIGARLLGDFKEQMHPIWCVRGGQVLNHDQ
jgi:hypothetical protein